MHLLNSSIRLPLQQDSCRCDTSIPSSRRANHQILCRQWVYVKEATANKLIARSADVLENFYKAICRECCSYSLGRRAYHKDAVSKTKPTDKGSKKLLGCWQGLVFSLYEDGMDRRSQHIYPDYKGYKQSDAYAPYRKLESDAYPDIMRIALPAACQRDFIDCGKEDKDAQEVVDILNRFYRETKHKVGVNGWTVEDHLAYRQSYAPDILQDYWRNWKISSRKDLLPKST